MSEARRCSAVKIVVSTSRMIGLVSPVAVSLSMDKRFFGAGILVFANNLEAFAGLFEHALRLLGFLENVGDLLQRRNFGDDALLQQQADFVDHHQLAGIGDGDGELPVGSLFQRHEVVAEHQLDGNFLEQFVMQFEAAQIDELAAVAPRHILRALQVGNRIAGRTDRPAVPAIHEQRFFIGRCHFLPDRWPLAVSR